MYAGRIGLVLAFGFLCGMLLLDPAQPTEAAEGPGDLVKRGEYLVTLGGCHDCHTPKVFTEKGLELDSSRLLSGHPEGSELPAIDPAQIRPDGWLLMSNQLTAAVGPWGVSFAVNLTSDEETGLGRWEEEAFIQTMRTGLLWGVGPPL